MTGMLPPSLPLMIIAINEKANKQKDTNTKKTEIKGKHNKVPPPQTKWSKSGQTWRGQKLGQHTP